MHSSFNWERFEQLATERWGSLEDFARALGYDAQLVAAWSKRLTPPCRRWMLLRLQKSPELPQFDQLWPAEAADRCAELVLPSVVPDFTEWSPGAAFEANFRLQAAALTADIEALSAYPGEARRILTSVCKEFGSYLGPFRRQLRNWTYNSLCDLHECATLAVRALPHDVAALRDQVEPLRRLGEQGSKLFVSPFKAEAVLHEVTALTELLHDHLHHHSVAADENRLAFVQEVENAMKPLRSAGVPSGELTVCASDFLEAHSQDTGEMEHRLGCWLREFPAGGEPAPVWPAEIQDFLELQSVFSADQAKELQWLVAPRERQKILETLHAGARRSSSNQRHTA